MRRENEGQEIDGVINENVVNGVVDCLGADENGKVDPDWEPIRQYFLEALEREKNKKQLASREEERCQQLQKEAEERGLRGEYFLNDRGEVRAVRIYDGEEFVGTVLKIDSGEMIHVRSTIPFAGYQEIYRYGKQYNTEETNWFGNGKTTYEVDLNAYHQSGNPLASYSSEALRDVARRRFGVDPGEIPTIKKEDEKKEIKESQV
ncbi:MAG: hypothetical protein WCT32_03895 [Patescibacteria group bacterium]|jgi:hypothetical protein